MGQTRSTLISEGALEQQSAFALKAASLFPALMLQSSSTFVQTFEDSAHNTPKSDFVLGDTVYAKASVPGGVTARRRIAWVDPQGSVRKVTDVTSPTQEDQFTLPVTPTSVVGTATLNNVGTWRVNIISNRGAAVAFAIFQVADPAHAIADLSIDKQASSANSQVTAGSTSTFDIRIANSGPSDAQAVQIRDRVPDNTTFVSMTQTSGPSFACADPANGVVICTINTLENRAEASFIFSYQVNPNTSVGTVISNTATISSTTIERNDSDNSSTASASVVSGPASECTLSCPEDISVSADTTENGQPGAHVTFGGATPEGDCGTVTMSPQSGSFFPTGTTIVTATSGQGGGSCSFTVTVHDAAAVTISCPTDKTVQANAGECSATVDPGTATATGNNVTVTAARSDGEPLNARYPAGTTTITWTATDPDEHTATCQQMITVEVNDTTPPTITAPPDVTASTGTSPESSCDAVVDDATLGTPTASDNCSVTVTRNPAGNVFPVGTTTITWTATDGAGNTATDTQDVTVTDAAPPLITVNGDNPMTVECHSSFTDPGATAHDSCAGDVPVESSGTVDTNTPGTYTITYTATDGTNPATATRTVNVVDNEAPTIELHGDNPMTVECGSTFTDPGATAHDGCAGDFAATASGNVDADTPGTYTITYNASDPSGNAATPVTRTVNVVDTTAPTIEVNGANPMTVECHTGFTDPGATAHDGCAGDFAATASGNVDADTPGTYTITYNASDPSGNAATPVTRTVNVVDTVAPVITMNGANPMTVECHSSFTDPGATANDACAGSVPVTSSSNVNPNAPGSYTITYSATDGTNSATATRTVIVVDTVAPTITLNGANPMTVECHSGFTDPGATASDACAGSVSVTASGSFNPNAPGSYTITYTANDGHGNTTTTTRTVNVVDTTAPTITLTGQTVSLWPPNHQYVTVNLTTLVASASDGCDSGVDINDVVISKVTSDEAENGNGDGNTNNDIIIASNCKSVQLRSERAGNSNGRVYTITFRVKDATGNVTTKTAKVTVPKNQNGGTAVDDGPHYTVNGNCP